MGSIKGRAKCIPKDRDAVFLPFQSAWIKDDARIKLMEKSRQIGISWSTAYGADERAAALKDWEARAYQHKETQIFIETPYRNRQMLETLISLCSSDTKICVATDLTLADECIVTRTSGQWRRQEAPNIDRRPTIFLLQA